MEEKDEVLDLKEQALSAIDEAKTMDEITQVKNTYLSKKSPFMNLMGKMKTLLAEEKAAFGQKMNKAREEVTRRLEEKRKELEKRELNAKLKKEEIDLTLPSVDMSRGGKNPYFIIEDEIVDIFSMMGYEIAEGPEVEKDHFNFELLNIPQDHPARDMQDTFYLDATTLMRTHTSPVQARVMQAKKGQPIKVICPGKVYRRDDDDATHSHQFAQIEGLLVDKNVTLGHLKATLELFLRKMYGEKREVRLRSSYFPFTEPSVEVDVSCECGGKAHCPVCKGTGWIEVLGGGMVHPNVLKMNGYDPEEYQGFAFGIGVERIAMLRYGIDDIRRFYTNDIRFLKQFTRK